MGLVGFMFMWVGWSRGCHWVRHGAAVDLFSGHALTGS